MDGISSLSRLQNTLNDAHTPQSLGVAIREIKNNLMSVAHK